MSRGSRRSDGPLSAAIRELEQIRVGDELEIERVDVDKAGGLQFTAATGRGMRWFSHDDRGLVEQTPGRDADIPLASALAQADTERMRVVSYRPGRRMVIEESLDGGRQVLKGYRRKKSTTAMFNHRVAEEVAEGGSFRVPRLLRQEAELDTLVFEHVQGKPLILGESASEDCFRIGSLLKRFQLFDRASELKTFGPDEELGVLEMWRKKALIGNGRLPGGWEAARELLQDSREKLADPQWGLCHRDLHDGQLLMVAGAPVLMDFDLLCRGDVALDPANLLAHFSLRNLQGFEGVDERAARLCGDALLDGLDRGGDAFWNRLRFYQGTAFLRLALVYLLRPRWADAAPSLTELGRKCLEEQIRIS